MQKRSERTSVEANAQQLPQSPINVLYGRLKDYVTADDWKQRPRQWKKKKKKGEKLLFVFLPWLRIPPAPMQPGKACRVSNSFGRSSGYTCGGSGPRFFDKNSFIK
jgi:hypothetical protein